ncbi:MAG: hypothetical protein M0D57_12160 [Sphingobacteriales bacterium JAD_PAG50586_3]|nr:MAG: hypothetical protein M0D57_12160 [Sphingobacteriales bacterium JAD_PAG50586_3]
MKLLLLFFLLMPTLAFSQITAADINKPAFVISQTKVKGIISFKKGQPAITQRFIIDKRKAENPKFSIADSVAAVKDADEEYTFCDTYSLFFQTNGTVGTGQDDNFFENGTWEFDEKKQTVSWTDMSGMTNTFAITKPADIIILTAGDGEDSGTEFIEYK